MYVCVVGVANLANRVCSGQMLRALGDRMATGRCGPPWHNLDVTRVLSGMAQLMSDGTA